MQEDLNDTAFQFGYIGPDDDEEIIWPQNKLEAIEGI